MTHFNCNLTSLSDPLELLYLMSLDIPSESLIPLLRNYPKKITIPFPLPQRTKEGGDGETRCMEIQMNNVYKEK